MTRYLLLALFSLMPISNHAVTYLGGNEGTGNPSYSYFMCDNGARVDVKQDYGSLTVLKDRNSYAGDNELYFGSTTSDTVTSAAKKGCARFKHNPTKAIARLRDADELIFIISNPCKYATQFAINFQRLDGSWWSVGWWKVEAESEMYLQYANENYIDEDFISTKNPTFYYYAEMRSPTQLYRWTGDHKYKVNGQAEDFGMRKEVNNGSKPTLVLTCPEGNY